MYFFNCEDSEQEQLENSTADRSPLRSHMFDKEIQDTLELMMLNAKDTGQVENINATYGQIYVGNLLSRGGQLYKYTFDRFRCSHLFLLRSWWKKSSIFK